MGLLNNLRSLTRSPPPSYRAGGSALAGRRGHHHGADSADDPALAAAVAASLGDNYSATLAVSTPVSGGSSYAANDDDDDDNDDARVAAAIAASLDSREPAAAARRQPTSNPAHAAQEIAFLTDRLLPPPPPPNKPYGRGGGGGGGHAATTDLWKVEDADDEKRDVVLPTDHYSGRGRGRGRAGFAMSVGAPPRGPRRTRTEEEDEALARRLQEQWISEDTEITAGGGVGLGGAAGGGVQWPSGVMTLLGLGSVGPGGRSTNMRVCVVCGLPITEPTYRYSQAGCFHERCVPAHDPVPPCKVCHERLPSQDGRFHFYRHNYFNDLYCPWHNDSAARCCSCMRLEPKPRPGGEGPFAELSDKRMLCMSCAQTAVVDSSEGAPAYQDICRFFEQELKLMVPREMREVPVLLVDSPTLNEQTHRDSSHGGGAEQGMPTTRGLTLSEVATLRHMAAGAMQFNPALGRFQVGPPTQVNLGERRAVTAILVLCGLPYASFSSILAHEAMHAWMKLDPSFPARLPPQVEEGVCQLIALLWLQHLAGQHSADDGAGGGPRNGDSPPSAEDLRGFFAHQIKTDISVVYGDGFRLAKAAYDVVGLDMLLGHVKRYQSFPVL